LSTDHGYVWTSDSFTGRLLICRISRRCLRIKLKCSLDHAKRSFYRSVNSIFGKLEELHPKM